MNKIIVVLLLVVLSGCGPRTVLDPNGPTEMTRCENKCQSKYKAHCSFVGGASGNYYCE
jgi:uncharacterized protein YceK